MEEKDDFKITSLSNFPLTFEKNMGQKDKEVEFIVRGHGYMAFFTEKEVVLTLMKIKNEEDNLLGKKLNLKQNKIESLISKRECEVSVLRVSLEGANKNIEIIGEVEQERKVNYFKGGNAEGEITNIPVYEKIRYKEVYNGIDVVFYGNDNQLEHDFIVKPGADSSLINFSFQFAESMRIDEFENLIIKVKTGELNFKKPTVFQDIDGNRKEIVSSYNIMENNKVGFKIDKYDKNIELNIDPVLYYSTYLGGNNSDAGKGIVADKSGNAYVVGYTYSVDFPKTSSEWQLGLKGVTDAFVTKINANGSDIIYSTYLGGRSYDEGNAIEVDDLGNAYIIGYTTSDNFPTTPGAYQTQTNYNGEVFITKLNPTGSSLIYSTYLGGSNYDIGYGIAIDDLGHAYVTGYTTSINFPTTAGAYQNNFFGLVTVFVTKLNPTGSGLIYSTYLGGGNYDLGFGIALDDLQNAYVVGQTQSNDFPTTIGAYQTRLKGDADVFITKLNSGGSGLIYSTYLGGSDYETGYGIAIDDLQNAYITGGSYSKNFPTTIGAYQTTLKGTGNAFITKINSDGSKLIYSTYLGGNNYDLGYEIAIDKLENAYVTGATYSSNFPTTLGAYQTTIGGNSDVFLTKINPSGSSLDYSTFLGGSGYDEGKGIAVDDLENIYVTGETGSINFPVTLGVYDTTYNGSGDVFITKFNAPMDLSIEKIAVPDPALIGGELNYVVKVTNNSGNIANGVVVTDTLLSSVQFILALFSKGTIKYSLGVLNWYVGSLSPGEVSVITIKVKPTALGVISNTATVSFDGIDPDTSNNTVTITSKVIDIYEEINNINNTVKDIEDKLNGTTPSLITDINDEVTNIEGKLDGTVPSLITEMKDQLNKIEDKINSIVSVPTGTKLTTGPVVRDESATTLVISINNSTAHQVSVRVTLVNYAITPGVDNTFTIVVPANSIKTANLSNPPSQYEVIFDGMVKGVYGWTSTKSGRCGCSHRCWCYSQCSNTSDFIASNTFRHSELVRKE